MSTSSACLPAWITRSSQHPCAAFTHLVCLILPVILYILQGWLFSDYTTTFVMVVLVLAAGFWIVKNVSGRRLAGLRWWNSVNPDTGDSEWKFEASAAIASGFDNRLFWAGLYGATAAWLGLGVLAFIRLSWDWLVLTAVAVGMNGANVAGYTRARSARAAAAQAAAQGSGLGLPGLGGVAAVVPGMASAMSSALWNAAMGSAGAPAPAAQAGSQQPHQQQQAGAHANV